MNKKENFENIDIRFKKLEPNDPMELAKLSAYISGVKFDGIFQNGKRVLKTGFRNDQPIALVENTLTDFEKYIVAFYYEVENNNLTWGYGYYYDDLESANKAFQKVINGGNLAQEYETSIDEQEKILQEEIFNFVDKVYKESQQQIIDNNKDLSLEKEKSERLDKFKDTNKKLETEKKKDRGAR